MCGGYNCCASKACSACCTIWCAFGAAILFFFYLLGHYDGPCDGGVGTVCIGNYFLVDITLTNMTSQTAGDICGLSASGYLFFALVCGGFWVYHDYVKKPVPKRRAIDEVEFSGMCLKSVCGAIFNSSNFASTSQVFPLPVPACSLMISRSFVLCIVSA